MKADYAEHLLREHDQYSVIRADSLLTEIEKIIRDLKVQRKRPVVFVCGLSGAGKSTFCESLVASFSGECVVFDMDWYLEFATEERWQRIRDALNSGDSENITREENPLLWYDWNSLAEDLERLQEHGNITIQNAWNQATGKKRLCMSLSLGDEDSVILCDGDYLLHPDIRKFADLTIMLDVPLPLCLERIRMRDAHRSCDEYLAYKALLRERYDIPYFESYRDDADIIIDNSGADWKVVKFSL